MKKNLFFVLSVVKTKMSVKRKLNMKTLKEKCGIPSHIEKGMTNIEAADKFSVPRYERWVSLSTSLESYSLKIELHPRNKQIFVTFSNPFDCNVVIVKLLKFFKETVKTLCDVSVNF